MLSETLANLTRRIAEEFDHLSDSDASTQAGGPPNPRLKAAPRSAVSAGNEPSGEAPSCTCAPETSRSTDPRPNSDAPGAPETRVAGTDRRPAKKATASTAGTASSSDSEEATDPQGATKDWQRTVIN